MRASGHHVAFRGCSACKNVSQSTPSFSVLSIATPVVAHPPIRPPQCGNGGAPLPHHSPSLGAPRECRWFPRRQRQYHLSLFAPAAHSVDRAPHLLCEVCIGNIWIPLHEHLN